MSSSSFFTRVLTTMLLTCLVECFVVLSDSVFFFLFVIASGWCKILEGLNMYLVQSIEKYSVLVVQY